MSDYGFKVSKPGKDVKTAGIDDLIFTSGRNVFGQRDVIQYSLTTGSDGRADSIFSFSYGYIPIVIVRVTTYNGNDIIVPNQWNTEIFDIYKNSYILEENFGYHIGRDFIRLAVYAHYYEPIQGGNDYPLANQTYIFTVVFFYNEMSEEY